MAVIAAMAVIATMAVIAAGMSISRYDAHSEDQENKSKHKIDYFFHFNTSRNSGRLRKTQHRFFGCLALWAHMTTIYPRSMHKLRKFLPLIRRQRGFDFLASLYCIKHHGRFQTLKLFNLRFYSTHIYRVLAKLFAKLQLRDLEVSFFLDHVLHHGNPDFMNRGFLG